MRTFLLIAVLAFSTSTSSLGAATLYVPFASNAEVAGQHMQTRLLASNLGNFDRIFRVRFIPANAPLSEAGPFTETRLGPRGAPDGAIELADLVPPDQVGFLQVRAAPQITVSSELEVIPDTLPSYRVQVPVVDAGNLFARKRRATIHTQIDYDTDTVLAGILKLGANRETRCYLTAFRPRGGTVVNADLVSAQGLFLVDLKEHLDFDGPLTGHTEAECAVAFAGYLVVVGQTVRVLTPAAIGLRGLP